MFLLALKYEDLKIKKYVHEFINAGRAAYDDTCAVESSDVVMLDYSGDPCEKCAKWEGRLFSLTGATPGLPTKSELIADGVSHPNCTHSYSVVPDYIRETEFNADGTPKQETQKATAPFVLGAGKDNESYAAKHDGKFTDKGKQLDKQMRKQKVPEETRDEINWNHTPKMQQLCEDNPLITVAGDWPGVIPGTRNMELSGNTKIFEGCRLTTTHEYGHYLANSIFDLTKKKFSVFEATVVGDWKHNHGAKWIGRYKGIADNRIVFEKLQNQLAGELFGNGYDKLSFEQQ